MKIKPYILFSTLFCFALIAVPQARADSDECMEHQIKAAFIYNFLKFVEWPEEKMADSNEPITIGVIGGKDFMKILEPVEQKKIKKRNISVKYFGDYEKLRKSREDDDRRWNQKIEPLKTCHLLLFCSCGGEYIEDSSQIIKALEGLPILTVGERNGFLESGGIINFLMEDKKVRFEINVSVAKKNKLMVSSKLLRLAKRVIKEKESQ